MQREPQKKGKFATENTKSTKVCRTERTIFLDVLCVLAVNVLCD
jgi:hypothetical protein